MIRVLYTEEAATALAEARSFLTAQPVLHNVILTNLLGRIARPELGRYWIAKDNDSVIGMLFQSPLTYPANLAMMSHEAIAALVDSIAAAQVVLPGVTGEAATAAKFAGQWTERTRTGAVPIQGQRIYALTELHRFRSATGFLRHATPQDRELAIDWLNRFATDIGEALTAPEAIVDRAISAQELWIWDDGEPVSMVFSREPVDRVVRVSFVYTPDDKRRRGYAEACVGELSSRLLTNRQRPILYTDLANPTSNSIYRRLGYRAIAECLRYRFA